jgi:SET domain-containing protein
MEKSKNHGKGIFAVADIHKDELIAVFGGKVMTRNERDALAEEVRFLALGIDDDLFIGPGTFEDTDDADWFNHSCDPNAGILGQVMLVAMREIERGKEIAFDYCMSCSQRGERRVLFACKCGAARCRGEVTNHDWKQVELQSRYKGYFSLFVQRNIDEQKRAGN